MTLLEFRTQLEGHPDAVLRFRRPDGAFLPLYAHVSEVARVEKHYIDCGGVLRADAFCRLQTWVADDVDHRLSAGKLLGILGKAGPIGLRDDLAVDVEIEVGFVTQMPLETVVVQDGELHLQLGLRHTDCLAQDRCQPKAPAPQAIGFRTLPKTR
jgi:hypothetical protein